MRSCLRESAEFCGRRESKTTKAFLISASEYDAESTEVSFWEKGSMASRTPSRYSAGDKPATWEVAQREIPRLHVHACRGMKPYLPARLNLTVRVCLGEVVVGVRSSRYL